MSSKAPKKRNGHFTDFHRPNPDAQRRLIQDCYRRAGLDLRVPGDRPQYFEAHGTGTPAGDPIEAEAISTSFFGGDMTDDADLPPLLVGSVKTVIGHSEGAAGIAAIMKTSLALQKSVVPPNLHFNQLNPKIRQFYGNLVVPTSACEWKGVEGQPRRASVNRCVYHLIPSVWLAKGEKGREKTNEIRRIP